jgi:hypothetical protein
MTIGIAERRADLVALVAAALDTATITDTTVCDDEPDWIAADRAIVVTWIGSVHDKVQWLHTYELVVIVPRLDATGFFPARDQLTDLVLDTLNETTGVGRPSAGTRTITLGSGDRAQDYPLCAVVTVTATASPASQ